MYHHCFNEGSHHTWLAHCYNRSHGLEVMGWSVTLVCPTVDTNSWPWHGVKKWSIMLLSRLSTTKHASELLDHPHSWSFPQIWGYNPQLSSISDWKTSPKTDPATFGHPPWHPHFSLQAASREASHGAWVPQRWISGRLRDAWDIMGVSSFHGGTMGLEWSMRYLYTSAWAKKGLHSYGVWEYTGL